MLSAAALFVSGVAGFSITFPTTAEAKTPGSTYCFYGKCHRVKTLSETEQLVGVKQVVQASFYDSCKVDSYNPCGLTSSGEAFRPDQPDNAASPVYPDGTTLLVWSPSSLQAAVLRVNNAGPYWGNRTLDVSRAAADSLGFKGHGVAQLEVRILDAPDQADATYKRDRKYTPVLGPVGRYASIDEAQLSLAAIEALNKMPATAIAPATLADAAALAARTMNTHALKLEVTGTLVADNASAVRPKATAHRRVAAKVKRVAKSRRQYARRTGARRNVAALRRGHHRAARYAHRRPTSPRRVASWRRQGTHSRQVARKWRKGAPIVTRTKRHRRVAEAHDIHGVRGGLLPSIGLRGIPTGSSREGGGGRIAPSRSGPVQVA